MRSNVFNTKNILVLNRLDSLTKYFGPFMVCPFSVASRILRCLFYSFKGPFSADVIWNIVRETDASFEWMDEIERASIFKEIVTFPLCHSWALWRKATGLCLCLFVCLFGGWVDGLCSRGFSFWFSGNVYITQGPLVIIRGWIWW